MILDKYSTTGFLTNLTICLSRSKETTCKRSLIKLNFLKYKRENICNKQRSYIISHKFLKEFVMSKKFCTKMLQLLANINKGITNPSMSIYFHENLLS